MPESRMGHVSVTLEPGDSCSLPPSLPKPLQAMQSGLGYLMGHEVGLPSDLYRPLQTPHGE